jgi:putative ABC transport system permease protein
MMVSVLRLTNTDLQAIQNQAKLISKISPVVSSEYEPYICQQLACNNNWGIARIFRNTKLEISKGQNISEQHIHTSAKVAVIGQTVVDNLFSPNEDPIGKRYDLIKHHCL